MTVSATVYPMPFSKKKRKKRKPGERKGCEMETGFLFEKREFIGGDNYQIHNSAVLVAAKGNTN